MIGLLLSTGCVVGDDFDEEALDDEDPLALGSDTAPIRIVQHNIEKKADVLAQTIEKAKAIKAHGIALQEVCPDQLASLVQSYGDRWTIGAVAGNKRSISGCPLPDGTQDFPHNVVIWTGGKGAKVTPYQSLTAPANAPGTMVCVRFERAKVPVHFCSAHLISADWTDPSTGTKYDGATLRENQTTKIKRIAADEWFGGAKNHFGILAGDLNGNPSTAPLDKLYAPQLGGTGDFTEYNRSGSSRDGKVTSHPSDGAARKIDYVFFSTNRAPINGPAVDIIRDASDHDMVVSTVHMKK